MDRDTDILAHVNQLVAEEKELRDAGQDPDAASVRPEGAVEGYLN